MRIPSQIDLLESSYCSLAVVACSKIVVPLIIVSVNSSLVNSDEEIVCSKSFSEFIILSLFPSQALEVFRN